MKCQFCGKELTTGAKVCDGCGAQLEGATVPSNNSNKNLKVIMIILIIAVLVCIVVGIILLTNQKDNSNNNKDNDVVDNNNNNNNNNNQDDEYGYISSEVVYQLESGGGYYINYFLLKNNGNDAPALQASIDFYSADNTLLYSSWGLFNYLKAGEETIIEIMGPKDYDHYEIKYKEVSYNKNQEYRGNDVILSDFRKDQMSLYMNVTNKSSNPISKVNVGVLFYKNGKVIYYNHIFVSDLQGNETKEDYASCWAGDYDDYKVIFVDAYTSK